MKTRLISARHSQGFTYMTVVITMILVGLMLAAYLKLVAAQNQLSMRSQTWNRSVPVLEAGIEEAIAHLNRNGAPDSSGALTIANLNNDGWWNNGSATGPWYKWGYMDRDFYFVSIGSWAGGTTNFPSISSTGYVWQIPAYAWNRPFSPFVADTLDGLVGSGRFSRRIVQCTTTNVPTFSKALTAKHGIDLNGNNVRTDSYDSMNPAYNDGTGRYSNTSGKWRDHGDIASNDTVTNSINVGNANIFGNVNTGPKGTVNVGPNGAVGDIAWQAAGNTGIQAGHSSDDMNVQFPDVVMPTVAWSAMPAGGTVDGDDYNMVFNLPGDYRMNSGNFGGKIIITAPNVRIRIDYPATWRFTGQDTLVMGTNGGAKIFLNTQSADISGQGIVNRGAPNQLYIFGTAALTSITLGGNGEQAAAIYAPYADLDFHGGGNNVNDFSGAAVVNSARLSGHYNFHFDESLGRNGMWRGFAITSWYER